MTERTISIAPSMAQYFEGAIGNALESRGLEATPGAKRYIVGLLCDFAHPDEESGSALEQPLTLLLTEAMKAPKAERFRRLRRLGDGVLYGSGYFRTRRKRLPMSRRYVLDVGRTAYVRAADMVVGDAFGPDILREMAEKFEHFADVLGDVADRSLAQAAKSEAELVKLYERWLESGSAVIETELGARGLTPVRNKGGLH